MERIAHHSAKFPSLPRRNFLPQLKNGAPLVHPKQGTNSLHVQRHPFGLQGRRALCHHQPCHRRVPGRLRHRRRCEVNSAIARARQAQEWWGRGPPSAAPLLRRVARLLNEEKKALAQVITAESGKPLQEALLNDVLVGRRCSSFARKMLPAFSRVPKMFPPQSGIASQERTPGVGAARSHRHHRSGGTIRSPFLPPTPLPRSSRATPSSSSPAS